VRPDEAPEAEHVAVIGQIGLTFDQGQFAPIDMDNLDAAGSLRAEQLSSIESCTTSRISVELLARLSSATAARAGMHPMRRGSQRLGFKHRGLARP